jgi:hypothetical protein
MRKNFKESELRLSIKKILLERLGVPEGITETAEKLYEDFMKDLEKSNYNENKNEYEFYFNVDYKISDLDIDSVKVIFQINKWNDSSKKDYVILGFATPFESASENDSEKLTILSSFDKFIIKFKFLVPQDWKFEGLINLLKKDRSSIINSFSHELMHAYDSYKSGYDDATERAGYEAVQNISFGVEPIDKFLHLLYFTHAAENVVRPTEIATAIKLGNVSQKNFLDFLKNNETYKMLDEARNFSYEKLRNELKKFIPDIDRLGQKMNHNMGSNDEEKIDEILRIVYVNLINNKGESYINLMTSNIIEKMLGLQGEKQMKLMKFLKKIQKFNNVKDFFKNEEKLFKFVANNMIKKISKLYDMTKSDNKSIKDWNLYHKVKKTDQNLTPENKFKVK